MKAVRQGEIRLVPVRCPYCDKLAADAAPGSLLQVKCSRCGARFRRVVSKDAMVE